VFVVLNVFHCGFGKVKKGSCRIESPPRSGVRPRHAEVRASVPASRDPGARPASPAERWQPWWLPRDLRQLAGGAWGPPRGAGRADHCDVPVVRVAASSPERGDEGAMLLNGSDRRERPHA